MFSIIRLLFSVWHRLMEFDSNSSPLYAYYTGVFTRLLTGYTAWDQVIFGKRALARLCDCFWTQGAPYFVIRDHISVVHLELLSLLLRPYAAAVAVTEGHKSVLGTQANNYMSPTLVSCWLTRIANAKSVKELHPILLDISRVEPAPLDTIETLIRSRAFSSFFEEQLLYRRFGDEVAKQLPDFFVSRWRNLTEELWTMIQDHLMGVPLSMHHARMDSLITSLRLYCVVVSNRAPTYNFPNYTADHVGFWFYISEQLRGLSSIQPSSIDFLSLFLRCLVRLYHQ